MNIVDLTLFGLPLAVACAVPGATTMMLVARVTAQGTRGIGLFCVGLIIGDLFWLLVAAGGAAALAATAAPAFNAIRMLGAAYLLYIAWKLWDAPVCMDDEQTKAARSNLLFAGLFLALGNAKTALFYMALVPTLVPLEDLTITEVIALSLMVIGIYGGVLAAYVVAAVRARRFFRDARARRVVNRIGSGIIAASAVLITLS